MMKLRNLVFCLLPLLLTSCTSYAPRVDATFKPGADTIVVFGRLEYTEKSSADGKSSGGYRMALQFSNVDTGKPLFVRFSKDKSLSCASIPGGHYKLTGFVATASSDRTLGGKVFGPEDKIDVQFTAQPNTAIYLGDFSGYVKYYVYGDLTTVETGLTQVTNNCPETTTLFHEKFPNLVALPVRSVFPGTP